MIVHALVYYRDEEANDLHLSHDPAELATYLRDFLEINDRPTFPDLDLTQLAERAGEELQAIIFYKQARVT